MKLTGFLLLAALLLGCIAQLRAPEYDEAYSIFLTAGDARPAWPVGVFEPGAVRGLYAGHASSGQISHDLKSGDVHPPLYFWLLEFWRRVFGPSWFAARLLSVVFTVGSLGLIAWFAAAMEIPVLAAASIALLSYGFAYTGIVARGFALAQLLNLAGACLAFEAARMRRRRFALAAGLAFGAASFTNYLAVFTGCSVLLWCCVGRARWRLVLPAALGMLPFLALDSSYFLAQRHSRSAQFVAFSFRHAIPLLAKDAGAAMFGGLPLYAGRASVAMTGALILLSMTCLACVWRRRHPQALLLGLMAIAPPCGLLALGAVFHNTPIEIRYLAFSLPFLALLFAVSLPRPMLAALLAVEAAAIAGLALAPSTMQPQGLAARQVVALDLPGALILLPFGNDGVGIPGPFVAALPDDARIELMRAGKMPNISGEPAVILANVDADAASRAATETALLWFQAQKCFAPGPATDLTRVYLNRCAQQQP